MNDEISGPSFRRGPPRRARVFFVALLLAGPLFAQGCLIPAEREARASSWDFAETWLARLEAGDQPAAWSLTSELTRLRYEEDETLRRWFGTRASFGELIERTRQQNWFQDEPLGLPDGNYREIIYWSEFARNDFVVETLWLVYEDDRWRLFGYFPR